MIKKASLFFFLITFFGLSLSAQNTLNQPSDFERNKHEARFVFYNTENLFDTENDSVKRDDDFTPDGAKHWNNRKYYQKLTALSKVIMSVGGWDLPEVVAFCELENRRVLEDLLRSTPLKGKGYQILHYESPDRRGIDVGMIYLPQKVKVLKSEPIGIQFPWDKNYKTRDILHAKLLLFGSDTLHFFVNHWPSKWGGHMETDKSRHWVGSTLKKEVQAIQEKDKNPVLIMGDLNDRPSDKSVTDGLGAKIDSAGLKNNQLFNLTYRLQQNNIGSHKYQSEWSLIDQAIVSYDLLNGQQPIKIKGNEAYIYKPDYLLVPDDKFQGTKPNRTYLGMSYQGGYSDHLPVYLDVVRRY